MPSTHQPRLLTWTIPTPQGLWYQAFVLVDSGLFATPRIDTTTMDGLKAAAGTDTRTVVEFLTDHGRSKRPDYLPWEKISNIQLNSLTGSIEVVGEAKVVSITVPDRERLEKIAKVLALAWDTRRKSRASSAAADD